jgi:hypothetical protein
MRPLDDPRDARAPGRFGEESRLFLLALGARTAGAASADGSVVVEVGADGAVHDWQLGEAARFADPQRLVPTLLEVIERARRHAYEAVLADFDLDGANETRAAAEKFAPAPTNPPAAVDSGYDDYDEGGSFSVAAPAW